MLAVEIKSVENLGEFLMPILKSYVISKEGKLFDNTKPFNRQYVEQSKNIPPKAKPIFDVVFEHLAENAITDIDKAFILEHYCRAEINKHWRIYTAWQYLGADISDHLLRLHLLSGLEKWQVHKQYAAGDLARLREAYFHKQKPISPPVEKPSPVNLNMFQKMQQENQRLKNGYAKMHQEFAQLADALDFVDKEREALALQIERLQGFVEQQEQRLTLREQEISTMLKQVADQKLTIDTLYKHNATLKKSLKRTLLAKKGQLEQMKTHVPSPCASPAVAEVQYSRLI